MLVKSIKQGPGYIRGAILAPIPLQLPRPYNGTCTHQHQNTTTSKCPWRIKHQKRVTKYKTCTVQKPTAEQENTSKCPVFTNKRAIIRAPSASISTLK